MKRIVALDLGSNAAAAYDLYGATSTEHKQINEGREVTKKRAGIVRMERPEVIAGYRAWLVPILDQVQPDIVIYERPFARGQAATRMLWGIAGVIEALAHDYGAAVLDATPGEIKNWATGKGKAEKSEMIDAARSLGYDGFNEHEADAFLLLLYARATLTTGDT